MDFIDWLEDTLDSIAQRNNAIRGVRLMLSDFLDDNGREERQMTWDDRTITLELSLADLASALYCHERGGTLGVGQQVDLKLAVLNTVRDFNRREEAA